MSRTAKVRNLFFGDGPHDFSLGIAQLEELEETRNSGMFEVYNRLVSEGWRIADIKEPLRLGLIGEGMQPQQAYVLVARNVVPGRLFEAAAVAAKVLAAAIVGAPEEALGEHQGEADESSHPSPTGEPAGPGSTAPGP